MRQIAPSTTGDDSGWQLVSAPRRTLKGRGVVGRVLVRSVTEHDWSAPPDGIESLLAGHDLTGLPYSAGFHGVSGFVHASIRQIQSVAPAVRAALEADYRWNLRTHLRALADLRRIAPVLDAVGKPWLVVKGPVLALGLYARPDLRAYGDIDVVVPTSSLGEVAAGLRGAGCSLVANTCAPAPEGPQGEIALVLPYGTPLDLHWHLLNDPRARAGFRIRMEELFERACPVDLDGVATRTLDAVDTLVYVCLHGCLSGGNRLLWIKDVERCIAVAAPPWDDVVGRCRDWGVCLAVAHTLIQARLLGADIPDEVIAALAPSRGWEALNRLARRLWPVERSTGRTSPTRLLARSVRSDPASSALELGRHVSAGISRRNPLNRRRNACSADTRGWGAQPADDDAELAAFLLAVAREEGRSDHSA